MSKLYYRGDIYSNYLIPKIKLSRDYIKIACDIKVNFDDENFGWPEIAEKLEEHKLSINNYTEMIDKLNKNMEQCITNNLESIRNIKIERIRSK